MHDFRAQRADTFQTFREAKGEKLPERAVVVFVFLAEDVKPRWADAERALKALGLKTRRDGDDTLEARTPPIPVTAEAVWEWEEAATRAVLPFDFWPETWELDG